MGERNMRREALVKGEPGAQGIFSLLVTGRHAPHMPFRWVKLESVRTRATSTKGQVRASGTAIIDPVTGRCLTDSGVDGSDLRQAFCLLLRTRSMGLWAASRAILSMFGVS